MSDEEVHELSIRVARLEEQVKALTDKIHDLAVWLGIIGSAVLVAAVKVIVKGA